MDSEEFSVDFVGTIDLLGYSLAYYSVRC